LRVEVRYSTAEASTELALGQAWCVKPSDALIVALTEVFGRGSAEIAY
jgi:DNA polymerase-3 subunit alpha